MRDRPLRAAQRADEGLGATVEESVTCCYAVQDKVWVNDPDGAPWELYMVLADAPDETSICGDGLCCARSEEEAGRKDHGAPVTPSGSCG